MARAAQIGGAGGDARFDGPRQAIALRRDGARPLRFVGAKLLSSGYVDAVTGARFTLELFVAEDGGAVARVTVDPPAESGGDPVHAAAPVAGPDALDALMTGLDPASALPFAPDLGPERHAATMAAADAMRDAYARFAASLRRAAPGGGDAAPADSKHPALAPVPQPAAPPVRDAAPMAALTTPAPTARLSAPADHPPAMETHPMSQMSPYAEPQAPMAAEAQAPMAAAALPMSLKRVGAKPLAFHGVELAMAMNFSPKAPSWYEVNLYRTAENRFVAAVKLFFASADEQDVARAWEFEDFGAAVTFLEQYDPADDVRVDVQPDDPTLSLPEMAAHALALRARATEARRQYAAVLGEVLHELDAA